MSCGSGSLAHFSGKQIQGHRLCWGQHWEEGTHNKELFIELLGTVSFYVTSLIGKEVGERWKRGEITCTLWP